MKYLNKFATEAEYNNADLSYPNISYIVDDDKIIWSKDDSDKYRKMPLAFKALDDMSIFNSLQMSYAINNRDNWYVLPANQFIEINAGDTIYFSNQITPSATNYNQFTTMGRFIALGNPLSMVYGLDFADVTNVSSTNNLFHNMFYGSSGMTDASHISLPATSLGKSCYSQMFKACTSLTSAPELPATTLGDYCYDGMFEDCTSLTTVPAILPAPTLNAHCYSYMFKGCTSMTTAPVLPADRMTTFCYNSMFSGCSSLNSITCLATYVASVYTGGWVSGVAASGTFTKATSSTSWSTGANGIPNGWTVTWPNN